MKVEQIYTGCLAQGAYYIESNGEVAIIDPLREVQPYIKKATANKAKIKYIFETHFHADFVSGHVTLAKETGADIIYGPKANPSFEAIIAKDNQEFKLGDVTIVALHTPGHTMESTTYLLKDEKGKDYAIFSGDTLFLGDVGRPDLAQKMGELTERDLAGFLYDSLREKIMPLANDVIVYPAHGAGSACGKNMMKETVEGYEDIKLVLERGTRALSPKAFEAAANETGAIVLDVRNQDDFAAGHIPRSIFIGLDGSFAPWVGALIADVKQPILLVTPVGMEEEAVTRLSRVGFDGTLGYLEGGFDAWKKAAMEYDTVSQIDANKLKEVLKTEKAPVFDVRKESEFLSEHILDAKNTPLDFLNDHLAEFPEKKQFYVHCAGGYRSMIAASILKSRGIHNLIDVHGGFQAIQEAGIPVSEFVCPTTL